MAPISSTSSSANRICGLTIAEFRRQLPAYRRHERWMAWDVVKGCWLAQENSVTTLTAIEVRQLARDYGLTRPAPRRDKGELLHLGKRSLASDYLEYWNQVDLDRPILFASIRTENGQAMPCLIDGHHRLHKAHKLRSPLKMILLSLPQTDKIRLAAHQLR